MVQLTAMLLCTLLALVFDSAQTAAGELYTCLALHHTWDLSHRPKALQTGS